MTAGGGGVITVGATVKELTEKKRTLRIKLPVVGSMDG